MQEIINKLNQNIKRIRRFQHIRIALFTLLILLTAVLIFEVMKVQDSRQRANGPLSGPLTHPIENKYPIAVNHPNMYIRATDFYLVSNGTKYIFDAKSLVITSAAFSDYAGHLDFEWLSNNKKIAMKFSLNKNILNTGTTWSVYSIRTVESSSNSATPVSVYYSSFDGAPINTPLQKSVFDLNNDPQSQYSGALHFENLSMLPFITPGLSPTPTPTRIPTPTPTRIPTPTSTPTRIPTPTPTVVPVTKTISLSPTDDAYSSSANPDTVYGLGSQLATNGQPLEYTFFKFDLTSLAGKKILSANFKLKSGGDASTNTQRVNAVYNTTWKEASLSYRNKPAVSSTTYYSFTANTANTWYNLPLTTTVKNYTGKLFSFAIIVNVRDRLTIFSKESSNKPTLVITYQ